MKSLKLLLLGLTVTLFSCSVNTPEQTIKDFYSAIKEKDFEKAKSLSTKQSYSTIDMLSSGLEVNIGDGELSKVDCVVENEKSECDCFFENSEKPIAVSAIKVDGKWKVDVKETAKQMMNNLLDSFKDIDLNSLLNKIGSGSNEGAKKINELIENIDIEKVSKTIKDLDSNMSDISEGLEGLLEEIKQTNKTE